MDSLEDEILLDDEMSLEEYEAACQHAISSLEDVNDKLETAMEWGITIDEVDEDYIEEAEKVCNRMRNIRDYISSSYRASKVDELPGSFNELESKIDETTENLIHVYESLDTYSV